MARFVVLSGPSCIGKGPLVATLERLRPELAARLSPLVLYNDRTPRPGEVDGVHYHFRPRAEIEALARREGYVVVEVRGDLQALEIAAIQNAMDQGLDPFLEGNPFVPASLREAGIFERFESLTVFLSPLSRREIEFLSAPQRRVDLQKLVSDVQRRKLLHRIKRQKLNPSLPDLTDIEHRAGSALAEMREAYRFDHVIPLHDGEGNDNWDAYYYPIGGAGMAFEAFVALLEGEPAGAAEAWTEALLG